MPNMRAPAPAPPKGFRKNIPLLVKLKALLINGPVLDADGNKVCDLEAIEWDHRPPLQQRVWNEESQDTEPASNDPNFIFPMVKEGHREKTAKQDIPQIAKTKRMAKDQEEFRRTILAKECGKPRQKKSKIPSRGFQRTRANETRKQG